MHPAAAATAVAAAAVALSTLYRRCCSRVAALSPVHALGRRQRRPPGSAPRMRRSFPSSRTPARRTACHPLPPPPWPLPGRPGSKRSATCCSRRAQSGLGPPSHDSATCPPAFGSQGAATAAGCGAPAEAPQDTYEHECPGRGGKLAPADERPDSPPPKSVRPPTTAVLSYGEHRKLSCRSHSRPAVRFHSSTPLCSVSHFLSSVIGKRRHLEP